ncbi:class II aldolase/adducin family protein [Pusillimonas noertemannii]|uniref:class II aldolase/adducin family protein n=1 Tax=Pusillimonas noertemannii TaxID=305977 RepID=UPI003341A4B9
MQTEVLTDLVLANHILFNEGVLDGFGHVSVRNPSNPGRFYIARSIAPATVSEDDILEVDLDGVVHDERNRRTYVERFIHSEIYKARPDVHCVVHSHSPTVIPFGVTGTRLRPVCHMSGFLGNKTPIYEIRDFIGESSSLLVTSQKLGKALADTLGSKNVALMRGHGSVAVGESIKQAVYRAIYTEVNARLQAQSLALGEPIFLSDGECDGTTEAMNDHLDRPWQLWVRRAKASALNLPTP